MSCSTTSARASCLVAALFAVFACTPSTTPQPPAQPDLVLVTIDTLRADHLGSYGYALDVSPNLDQVAAEGVRFDEATAHWPSTWPSTASLLTGTYPGRNGVVWSPKRALDWNQETLAEILSGAGYNTGAVVSNASIGRRMQFHQGFDTFVESWLDGFSREFPGRPYRDMDDSGVKRFTDATIVTNEALAWLDQQPRDEPVFLWVHYMDPHGPYIPPKEYAALFPDAHASHLLRIEDIPKHQRRTPPGAEEPTADLAYYIASYDREIRYLDDQVARLLDGVFARWKDAPGLLVVTADHGESFHEHGEILGHGKTPFRPTTRVPLLLRMPGRLPAGQVVETPVGLVNLLPTVLELLGLETPPQVQGRTLLTWIENPAEAAPAVFGHAGVRQPPQNFVRRGRFKLVHSQHPRDVRQFGEFALYDLQEDPGETRNALSEHPEVAGNLRRELDAFLAENWRAGATGGAPVSFDPLESKLLRQLGYVD
ncbi:MAG: sulfatase [Myxococcota bacterium]|nr:sulfatase [Myxococcota bacterium]